MEREKLINMLQKLEQADLEKLKSKIWLTVFYAVYLVYFAVDEFYVKNADLLHYDYVGFAVNAVVVYFILLVIISAISGMAHGNRYDKAKKRIDQYYDLLEQINEIE